MKSISTVIVAAGLVGCSTGVGVGEAPRGQPSASSSPAALMTSELGGSAHVLGVLQMRDQRVTLMAARDGMLVTVRDGTGAIVAQDVKVEDLRETEPFLYEVCRSATASNHYLDARLDRPQPLRDRRDGSLDDLR